MEAVPGFDQLANDARPDTTTYPITEEAYIHFLNFKKQLLSAGERMDIYFGDDFQFYAEPYDPVPAVISKTTITADGKDSIVISGLPNFTNVMVEGVPGAFRVEDGVFEFTYDCPNKFHIVLESHRYEQVFFVIQAVAP